MKKHCTRNINQSDIFSVDFLRNNSDFIVCGDYVGNISLFSTKLNKNVWTNKDSAGSSILSVAVSPNIKVVAGGGVKNLLYVINAANGICICSVGVDASIRRVLFLSRWKIACGLWNGTVAIVCWQTQKIEKILNVGERAVLGLAISPINNDILLTGDFAGVIKQKIISTEKTVMIYEGHTNIVTDLRFLCCGTMFVSGSSDFTAGLFALGQKYAVFIFKGHTNDIRNVSLIHDDELLMTISWDNTVKVWGIESGECFSTVEAEQNVICGAVSKDEKSFVFGEGDGKFPMFSCPPRSAVSLDRKLKLCRYNV